MGDPLRSAARLVAAIAFALLALLATSGCTVRYTVPEATTVQQNYAPSARSEYTAVATSERDLLEVRLESTSCEHRTVTKPVMRMTEYKKTSFIGGPGLAIGGVLLAAAGTASFVTAKDQPDECAEGDWQCTSKDEARGLAYAAWGLGAAGVAVGLYNTFKAPVALKSWYEPNGAEQRIEESCTLPTGNVPVTVVVGRYSLGPATTREDGWVAFALPDDAMDAWQGFPATLYVESAPPRTVAVDLSLAGRRASERRRADIAMRVAELLRQMEQQAPPPAVEEPPDEPEEPPVAANEAPPSSETAPDWEIDVRLWATRVIDDGYCKKVVAAVPEVTLWLAGGSEKVAASILAKLAKPYIEKLIGRKFLGWVATKFVARIIQAILPKQLLAELDKAIDGVVDRTADSVCNTVRRFVAVPP